MPLGSGHISVENVLVVSSSVNMRYSKYMCFEAEKWNRTTYSDYSLSWYNLAGEKAKWWDQDRKKEGRKKRERRLYILQSTFCRQPSIFLGPPSGDRLWVRITLSPSSVRPIVYQYCLLLVVHGEKRQRHHRGFVIFWLHLQPSVHRIYNKESKVWLQLS